jgi:hypothetical protein
MNFRYPLFILAKDDLSMDMIIDSKQLEGWYEQPDIEEGLYMGWDMLGYPLKIMWDLKIGPKVEIIQDNPELDKLREAILNYVKLYRPKVPFVYSGPKDDVVALYKAVEEHINTDRLRNKIKKFFIKFRKFPGARTN